MIKKVIKTILIVLMILGIAVSISNFISLEVKAKGDRGVWVDLGGVVECTGDGNQCDLGFEF
ncbi:hypothetical protein ACFLQP_00790 [Acidobacteriota bacterium]